MGKIFACFEILGDLLRGRRSGPSSSLNDTRRGLDDTRRVDLVLGYIKPSTITTFGHRMRKVRDKIRSPYERAGKSVESSYIVSHFPHADKYVA